MKLKTSEVIEIATTKFIGILQQAVQAATTKRHPLGPASNLPSEIYLQLPPGGYPIVVKYNISYHFIKSNAW
jgi:hypothetical protein